MAETVKRSRVTSAQSKAVAPAPKSSQSGYGHKSRPGGRTTPQGSAKNPPGRKPT